MRAPEHRHGGDGSEGKSLTFFDPAAKRWHQTWIDNTTQPLFMNGDFEGESLVLKGKTGEGALQTKAAAMSRRLRSTAYSSDGGRVTNSVSDRLS